MKIILAFIIGFALACAGAQAGRVTVTTGSFNGIFNFAKIDLQLDGKPMASDGRRSLGFSKSRGQISNIC